MKNNIIILTLALFLISSCSGFKLKRSENPDEFLIQKKNPLVMPPDIDDLPKPNENALKNNDEDFKEILNTNKDNDQKLDSNQGSSLKGSILKKIED